MDQKSRLILNSIINISTNFFSTGIRFFLVPFILGIIGRELYGIWVILGSFFAYANILQLGLNSSVTRIVPYMLAKKEISQLNSRVNTVVAYFIFLAFLLFIITLVAYHYFFSWFTISAEFQKSTQIVILIIGFSQMICFPLLAYAGILSGMQRYELPSFLNISGDIIRIILIFSFLTLFIKSNAFIFLAIVSSFISIMIAVFKARFAFKICPDLKFKPWKFNFSFLIDQMTYGINSTLYILSGLLLSKIAIFILGSVVSTKVSADYGVAMMIIIASASIIEAFCRGVKPAASKLEGENNVPLIQKLLLRSTRYNSTLAFSLFMIILIFGPSFFNLWIGAEYLEIENGKIIIATIIKTAMILGFGYLTSWLVQPAYMVVNGLGKHLFPAITSISAGLIATLIIIPLAKFSYSIDKIAFGITIPMILTFGIAMPIYCCCIVKINLLRFLSRGIIIPAIYSIPAILLFYFIVKFFPPVRWPTLILQIALFLVSIFILAWIFILTKSDKQYFKGFIFKIKRSRFLISTSNN